VETLYLRRCEDFVWRDIGGEVVILNEEGTQVCLLNKTASSIWTLCDGTKALDEIAAQLCDRFDVSSAEALADVQEFADELVGAGLVVWSA